LDAAGEHQLTQGKLGAGLLIVFLSLAVPISSVAQTGAFKGSTELVGSRDLAGSRFGQAIALSRDTLAVGAYESVEGGAVYVFERDKNLPERWSETTRLTSETECTVGGFGFGFSVALDGDTLVVGAPNERTKFGIGAVYIYYRNYGGKNRWGLVKKVRATASSFGWSVAISGDTVLASADGIPAPGEISAPGEVYVLERNRGGANRWQKARLEPSKELNDSGMEYVAISGDTLVIGAHSTSFDGYLIFDRDRSETSGWKEIRKLGKLHDHTGAPFALDGSTFVASSYLDGLVYIHERNLRSRNHWGRRGFLESSDLFDASVLGRPVAVRGNTIAARGKFEDIDGSIRLATFVFDRHDGGKNEWHEVARLAADGEGHGASFSRGLAIGPREVVRGFPDRFLETGLPDRVVVYHRRPILADDFETADLSDWTQRKRKVSVVRPGLGGSEHALEVTLDGKAKKSFVRSKHPVDERTFSLSFLLLANSVDLGGREVEILRLSGGRKNVELRLEEEGGQYFVGLWAGHDKGAPELVGRTTVPARREVKLSIEWNRATGPGHNNGIVRLFKKNRLVAEATDMDTDQLKVSDVRLGLPGGSRGTGGGSFLIDLYDSNR
jgi:hypothetical protein